MVHDVVEGLPAAEISIISSKNLFSFSKNDLFLFSAKVPIHDSVAIIDTKATRLFLESSSLYRQNEIYTGDFFAKVL